MWWSVLGVDREADRKTIKRAYGRLIKEFRPETHPKEFGDIREAYEHAIEYLKYAEKISAVEQGLEEVTIENQRSFGESAESSLVNQNASELNPDPFAQYDVPDCEFPNYDLETSEREIPATEWLEDYQKEHQQDHQQKHQQDYQKKIEAQKAKKQADLERQQQVEKWFDEFGSATLVWQQTGFKYDKSLEVLLNHPGLNNYECFQMIRIKLFEFILERIRISDGLFSTSVNIDHFALYKLDQLFNWSEDEVELNEMFDSNQAGLVFYGIREGTPKNQRKVKDESDVLFGVFKYIGFGIVGGAALFAGMFIPLIILVTLYLLWKFKK